MKEKVLKRYIGKTVTILIDVPKENQKGLEGYGGIIDSVEDGTLVLRLNNPDFFIKELAIICEKVISVRVIDPKQYRPPRKY